MLLTEKNNFKLALCDTDSMALYKPDCSEWTDDEKEVFLKTLNGLMEDKINWDDDGIFNRILVIKTKNYVLDEAGKDIVYKGSGFADTKKEPALKEMLYMIANALLEEQGMGEIKAIYDDFIREANRIEDHKRWLKKVTVTKKLFDSPRKNETKIVDALKGETVSEGNKVWIYADIDGEIPKMSKGEIEKYKDGSVKTVLNKIWRLEKHWNGVYDREHYFKRVYNTVEILAEVLDPDEKEKRYDNKGKRKLTQSIPNYTLAKNKKLLKEVLGD